MKCSSVHLANELLPPVSKQHEGKVVIDAVYLAIRKHSDEAADVSKNPHHTLVHTDLLLLLMTRVQAATYSSTNNQCVLS